MRRFCYYSQGRRLDSLDLTRCGSRFGFLLDLPQDEIESLLRARVSELGGGVEQGMELISLSAGPDAVMAAVRERAGQVREITARYVVGCDGAHNWARRELGLSFHGHPYAEDWLLADARLGWQCREDEAHAFVRPDGLPLICFQMREHRWRLILPTRVTERPGSHASGGPAAGRPAGAGPGYGVRSQLAGELPLASPVTGCLPSRPHAAGR